MVAVLSLILGLSLASAKATECDHVFSNPDLQHAVTEMRGMGLTNLLADLDMGNVKVSPRKRKWPWQPAVSWKVHHDGSKSLIVRPVKFKSESARQKYVWDVAVALFELKMREKFMTETFLIPTQDSDGTPVEFATPRDWRDRKLAGAESSLRDLYKLFGNLPLLEAREILPAKDLAKIWPLKVLMLRKNVAGIAPNRADFELLLKEGEAKFGTSFTERHKRALLYEYYVNHLRRTLTVTAMAATAAGVGAEIPGYLEAVQSWDQFTAQMGNSIADNVLLFKIFVDDLYDKYPWVAYILDSLT